MSRYQMNRRRLASPASPSSPCSCLVGVSILAVAAGGSALAYEVNGTQTSQDTSTSQLDDIADTKGLAEQVVAHRRARSTRRSRRRCLTANIVLRGRSRDAAERQGRQGHRRRPRRRPRRRIGTQLDKYPASYRDLSTSSCRRTSWRSGSTATTSAERRSSARRSSAPTCSVDPRYGRWNPQVRRVPAHRLPGAPTASG